MLIGFCLILIFISILIQQFRDQAYLKEKLTIGKVNKLIAGIVSFVAGLYFFISSF